MTELLGIGLYTPAEAGRLADVAPSKIIRWLRGHRTPTKTYAPLWKPEVSLDDRRTFLGFRDLMEVRVVDAFIHLGISPQKVRSAIALAGDVLRTSHPLSTNSFRTDGREIFLEVLERQDDGEEAARLLNLFRRQYEFSDVIEPILKTVDFSDDGAPSLWWPRGREAGIVVDPRRAFGAPIDSNSSIPTAVLSMRAAGVGVRQAAEDFEVPESTVLNAVDFEAALRKLQAA